MEDGMDYVMHGPAAEPATPRSRPPPHSQSGCPYFRGDAANPLPHPNTNPGLSPHRSHYDPVHAPGAPWFSQPPQYWHQSHPGPSSPFHTPPHPSRLSLGDAPFFTQLPSGPRDASGPLHMPPLPHDPFGPVMWPYQRRRHAPTGPPPERVGEGSRGYGAPPGPGPQTTYPSTASSDERNAPSSQNPHERYMHPPSAPRNLSGPSFSPQALVSPQPPALPAPSTQNQPSMSSPADNSPTPAGRSTNTMSGSPIRGTHRGPAAVAMPLLHNPTPPASSFHPSVAIPHPHSTGPPPASSSPARPLPPPAGRAVPAADQPPRQHPSTSAAMPAVPADAAPVAGSRQRARSTRQQRPGTRPVEFNSEDEYDAMEEEESLRELAEHFELAGIPFPPRTGGEDERIRTQQLIRGAAASRRVASRSAISSLQSVDLDSLPETERTCIICYNEFGTPTPEGINEAPLRLPKCKHVFGDHCIKKWFEESDSCPYCRDKVPSEAQVRPSQSAVHQFLRAQALATRERWARESASVSVGGESVPVNVVFPASEAYMRLVGGRGPATGHAPPRSWQPGERRSPPDEPSETRRRTRARHSSFRGSPPSAGPGSLFGQPPPPGWMPGSGSSPQQQIPAMPRHQAPPMGAHPGLSTMGPLPVSSLFSMPGVQGMSQGPPLSQLAMGAPPLGFGGAQPSGATPASLFSNPLNNGPSAAHENPNLFPMQPHLFAFPGPQALANVDNNPFAPGPLTNPPTATNPNPGEGWQ